MKKYKKPKMPKSSKQKRLKNREQFKGLKFEQLNKKQKDELLKEISITLGIIGEGDSR